MSDLTVKTALIVNDAMVGVLRVFKEFEKQKDRLAKVYSLEDSLNGKVAIPDTVDTVIFGAWDDRYLSLNFPIEKKYCLWTSPIAQSELEPYEIHAIIAIKNLVEKGTLTGIWFGSSDFLNFFPNEPKRYFFAPYPISIKRPPLKGKDDSVFEQKHISMFGPLNIRKNFFTQMAAVKATNSVVHTNRMDELQKRFCDTIGVKYVNHAWMPEKEYYSTIQSMDLGMQVSFNGVESLSYVWIDHLMMGVPCLTSVRDAPAQLFCNCDDIHRMTQKIREGFEFQDWREWVKTYAENRNRLFNKVFSELGL